MPRLGIDPARDLDPFPNVRAELLVGEALDLVHSSDRLPRKGLPVLCGGGEKFAFAEAFANRQPCSYSVIRYLAKPPSPSPAGSIFTPLMSAMYCFAFWPVSKITVAPASGANDQLASAEGLMVPWSMI